LFVDTSQKVTVKFNTADFLISANMTVNSERGQMTAVMTLNHPLKR